MSLWRVRISMPADPVSQEWLAAALSGQRVLALLPPDGQDQVGEVIIDLPRDDSLGTLLSDLHVISPHVYVSGVSAPPELAGESAAEQAGREGLGEPALVTAGRPASPQDQSPV